MPIIATIVGGFAAIMLGDFLKDNEYKFLAAMVWVMGFVFVLYMMTLW